MKRTNIWMDNLSYDRTHTRTHTHTHKGMGWRGVPHFRRMRSSVSQPSLLLGNYMLDGTQTIRHDRI